MLNIQKRTENTSGIRGISYDNRCNMWTIDFEYRKIRFYFKPFKNKNYSVYIRYLAENYFLKEYRNLSNDEEYLKYINDISDKEKETSNNYFYKIINKKKYLDLLIEENYNEYKN